ncbi:hypothetical protein [Herbidospora daliensis]|uniref:hypothetical protein n=1 Tax=Herbidospora daliensis TaxID=295585 RepID=UPI000783F922|nr:hypothetical protein [Herbidospora daliensis]
MTEEQEPPRGISDNVARLSNILEAQAAMNWAYRGNLPRLQTALARMTPEQLRELSSAAAMLSSTADRVLGEKAHE